MKTYALTISGNSSNVIDVNEGGSVYLDLVTTNVPEGEYVNFNFSGTISDSDTQWGLGSRAFQMGPNGFINIGWTFVNDAEIEGMESLIVSSVEDPSQSITINIHDMTTAASSGTGNTTTSNQAPTIPTASTATHLNNGTANTPYPISESQLLAGFNDVDGDQLSIENLTVTNGSLNKEFDGWTFIPNSNYSGNVQLNYSVSDGRGGYVAAPALNFYLDKAFNNPPTGSIYIEGVAKAGTMLSVNSISLNDIDGINYSTLNYQWFVNNSPVTTGYNYTVAAADTGKTISVKATYTDFLNNNETMKSGDVIVQSAPTYSIFADKYNVNEGQSVMVTVQSSTNSAQPNEMVNLIWSGNVTSMDMTDGFIPTSVMLGSDGKGQISLNFLNDRMKEGSENLKLMLTNDSTKFVTINVNDPINNPPTGVVMLNGDAKVGSTLFALPNNIQDPDGLGMFNYQWMSNGVIIGGKTGENYTLTKDDANKNISVQISYTDGLGNLEKLLSSPLTVQSAPATYSFFADKPNVNEGETVNLTLQTTNVPAGTEVKMFFGGSAAIADTQNNVIPTSFFVNPEGKATLPLTFLKDKINEGTENLTFTLVNDPTKFVTININDAFNNPPTGELLILGDAKVGKILNVQNNVKDLDGIKGESISYQWLVNDNPVAGKTQQNYAVAPEDANKNISVQVNYTDGLGNAEKMKSSPLFVSSQSSQPTAKPTYTLNVDRVNVSEGESVYFKIATTNVPTESNISMPFNFSGSITSSDVEKDMLSPSNVWIDKDGLGTVAVTFLKDSLVEGKENLIATLINDPTKSVTVTVNDSSKKSNNLPTGTLTIDGDAKVGEVLTVENTLADADGLGKMTYQWLRNSENIADATQDTYTLTKSDLGKAISVTASYVDGQKNNESQTSDETDIVELSTATYALSASKTEVNEGDKVVFKLVTTNLPEKTEVAFDWSGEIDENDIVGGLPESHFVIDKQGKASFTVQFDKDKITEGDEALSLTLSDDVSQNVSIDVADTSTLEIVNHKPTGTVTIEGTAKVGNVLAITNTLKDEDGIAGSFNYQWLADGKAIKNASEDTYKLTKNEAGKKISVQVSYIDELENAESKTSSPTTAVKKSVVIDGLTKTGTANKDKLIGAAKNDDLSGLAGNDTLRGEAGNDLLDGGAGNDSVLGGNGNDSLDGGDGNDTLVAGSGNDALDGGKGNDILTSEAGNDTLNGGAGTDKMDGGAGDDYYVVDNLKDAVTETLKAGTDSVESSQSYTLGANVENLILSGILGNSGTGNELNNTITGNVGDNKLSGNAGNDKLIGSAGADTLDGGKGMDTLTGGDDDDTYLINNTEDKIIETAKGGEKDEIISSVDYDLSTSGNIEILTLTGKAKEGTGDENDNVLQEQDGGSVANIFDGKEGDDAISSDGGNDTLTGGDGDDVLDGGKGTDTAIFTGVFDDYLFTRNADAEDVDQIIVEYVGTDESVLDGKDILTSIEVLEFADGDSHNIREVEISDSTSSELVILTGVVS